MSYKILVTAADIFVGEFYRFIRYISVSQAALHARRTLVWMKSRIARFRKVVSVEDWIVPVIYQNESCLDALQLDVTWRLIGYAMENRSVYLPEQHVSEDETRSRTSNLHQRKLEWHSSMIIGRNFNPAVVESKLLL